MRKVTGGSGADTTSTVLAFLQAGHVFEIAHLYLIGEPDDPVALFLTDWQSPLKYPVWGTFKTAAISRAAVKSQIGLQVDNLDITWSPAAATFTQNTQTAGPLQLAHQGFYDNKKVRVWKVYMPTPGDASTYGASELFGGWIAKTEISRGVIKFTVQSFLNVIDQYVPGHIIELTDNVDNYAGVTPPAGVSSVPQFAVIAGSSQTVLILDATSPSPHHIFGTNALFGGAVFFNKGGSQTLGGIWSGIASNKLITISSVNYNQVALYTPLPWAPTPGVDTCFIGARPNTGNGFLYVPAPESAV
ncbi:MAG TPA: DUF2163 domain-containing protein [Candidatus Angelobacter sp.]|nr:DUF2163 domain-containing protein [Candidatus Angelobacter sp.]